VVGEDRKGRVSRAVQRTNAAVPMVVRVGGSRTCSRLGQTKKVESGRMVMELGKWTDLSLVQRWKRLWPMPVRLPPSASTVSIDMVNDSGRRMDVRA